MLVLAVVLYAAVGASWWLFAALFLAPDLAMVAYAAGPRAGALAYNAVHVYTPYALLGGLGLATGTAPLLALALVGMAHIGFDRALGYGLKQPSGFRDTHLGRIGASARATGRGAGRPGSGRTRPPDGA